MKFSTTLICIFLFQFGSLAQVPGQSFCDGTSNGSYFPLTIKSKKIIWYGTTYTEVKRDTITIAGKVYTTYDQNWADGTTSQLYFREKNGIVYQYEMEHKTEFVRYDPSYKKGRKWKGVGSFASFKVMSMNETLQTPICKYENLMMIKGTYSTGDTYNFYYLKGFGYVGASNKKGLVSFVSPK